MMHERNKAEGGRLTKVSGALLVRRFSVRQPEMYRVVESVLAKKLTSLDKASLCEMAQTVMDIEYDDLEGDFLEMSRESGAAVVITEAKRRSRPIIQINHVSYEKLSDDEPIAFAHVSGAGDAMRFILERLAGRLVPGGHIIIDDYKTKEECREAVDEYFHGKKGFRLERKSRLHVIRA